MPVRFVYVIVDKDQNYVGDHTKFTGVCTGFVFFETKHEAIDKIIKSDEEGLHYKSVDIHKIPKGKPIINKEYILS